MRFVRLPERRHPAPYFGPVVLKLRRASFWLHSGKKAQAVNRELAPIAVRSSWKDRGSLGRPVMCHVHGRGPRMRGTASVAQSEGCGSYPYLEGKQAKCKNQVLRQGRGAGGDVSGCSPAP